MSGAKPALSLPWGELRLDVWTNHSKRGFVYYTYELSKSFKDQAGNWKKIHGLYETEIDHAITLLTEMKRRILEKKGRGQSHQGERKNQEPVSSEPEPQTHEEPMTELDFPPLAEGDEVPF